MRVELCGPLGIGKTTLAKKLSDLTNWQLIEEPVEKNPFLRAFYTSPAEHAFEKNLFFLLDYLHEIKSRKSGDFIFDHSALVHRSYAALNRIEPHEKAVFIALDNAIAALPTPDILINLTCPPNIILDRIAQRGRDFESTVDIHYIMALHNEMQSQVKRISKDIFVINIDAAKYNFEKNEQDVQTVLSIIQNSLGTNVQEPLREVA